MRRFLTPYALMVILVWPAAAWALLLEPTAGIRDPVSLSGHLAARCVANDKESIQEVAEPSRASEFATLPALLMKGYTRNTCWLRFELQRMPESPEHWLLEVGMPYLDDVTLFMPHREGADEVSFRSLRLGDRFPYAERPIPHRLFVFPVDLSDARPMTAYLRIQTTSTMLLETLNFWQYPGLIAATQHEAALYWLVFGVMALGALSNLVFWIWLREGIYRSYTLYLVSLLLLNLANSGFATQWLWSNQPIVADRSIGVLAALIFLVGLLFFNEVLGLKESFPRLGRGIPYILTFYAACLIAALLGFYTPIAPVLQAVALTVTTGITIAGPWSLLQGKKHLRLYVLAFSTQLFIAIAVLARNLGVWPLEIPIDHFILGATAIHVVLLNFALAERVRHAQREKLALENTAARLESEQFALNQQKEFMSMVAHEFRTPLTIIDTSAQRIAANSQSDSDRTAERCTNIREAVQRLTALMDEFLTLDRMEGQIRRFRIMECAIDDIIDSVLTEFPQQRIDVRRSGLPASLLGDPALLRIAVANLLSNALRFSPPECKVRLTVERLSDGWITVSVADDGPGIPDDEQPRLFEKYFRGRNSQTKPGAGLGLYLVEQVAKLHRGSVSVSSREGDGSRFELRLPI